MTRWGATSKHGRLGAGGGTYGGGKWPLPAGGWNPGPVSYTHLTLPTKA